VSGWFGDILFANGRWVPAAVILWLLFTIAAWFSYRRSASPEVRWLGTLLRSIGIGILCFCLLEPFRSITVPKSQANSVAVLVDNSRSMRALYEKPDLPGAEDGSGTDGFHRERLLANFAASISDDAGWLQELGTEYRIRKYSFAGQLNPVDAFESWDGSEYESNIQGAIQSLETRYPTNPPAAIVLITDGRSTNAEWIESSESELSRIKTPVFPVIIPPTGDSRRDLWIRDVSVQTSDFETAPVTVMASVGHHGFVSEKVEVRLEDLNQTVLQTQHVEIASGGKNPVVRFQFRPKETGSQGYRIVCKSLREIPGLEMTQENNHRFVAVDRAMGPYRILYLAGRPNWEYKFLQRALSEDPEVSLSALVRIAKKAPKFSFRAKGNEDTNPLFSGFEDISEEEKEKYNEPVFARLGVVDKDELVKGFPRDAEELFAYSMIIIDDLETEFFTVDQLQLLRQFVSHRGGSLLMLGGQESMRGRGFRDSVLGQLLPVYGDPNEPDLMVPGIEQEVEDPVRFRLSREGWLLPYLRLSDNEIDERKRLEQMPAFQVWNRTSQVKVGARVLVEGELTDGNVAPMLVVQKFGKGTTGALMIGDLWRWALRSQEEKVSPFYQGWRQIIRGMMIDIPRRVQMTGIYDRNQNAKRVIQVQVRDQRFSALDNATVEVRVRPPKGESLTVQANASMDQAGLYETSFLMRDSGVYHVTAEAREPDGELIGESQLAFVHEPEALELANCSLDEDAMRDLANSTGGEVIPYGSLNSLKERIPTARLRYTEQRTVPLWHTPWLLGLAVGCLAIEWLWRRRYGLA
jgi:uncharacterized membrane protein